MSVSLPAFVKASAIVPFKCCYLSLMGTSRLWKHSSQAHQREECHSLHGVLTCSINHKPHSLRKEGRYVTFTNSQKKSGEEMELIGPHSCSAPWPWTWEVDPDGSDTAVGHKCMPWKLKGSASVSLHLVRQGHLLRLAAGYRLREVVANYMVIIYNKCFCSQHDYPSLGCLPPCVWFM